MCRNTISFVVILACMICTRLRLRGNVQKANLALYVWFGCADKYRGLQVNKVKFSIYCFGVFYTCRV